MKIINRRILFAFQGKFLSDSMVRFGRMRRLENEHKYKNLSVKQHYTIISGNFL